MKLAALLACACVVFVGCSDSGATASGIEDDANIPIEGDATSDSTAGDSTGDSMMATDSGMAADTGGKTDTGTPADTGGGAKLACGSASCDPATQVCCAGTPGTSCIAKSGATCPVGEFKYGCTQPADCTGGQVCCASATGGASCATTCPGTTVCSSNTDCKGALKNCKAVPGVPSIKVCSA